MALAYSSNHGQGLEQQAPPPHNPRQGKKYREAWEGSADIKN